MKAAIYNPYLDTLGGGERYTMAVANLLKSLGYDVFVEWKDAGIKNDLEKRFGINLEGVSFVDSVKKGDGYDICFWVSDGSVPLLLARTNFLHFQVPFSNVGVKSLINRMKFFRIKKVICNSNFTKKVIDKEYGINSVVTYPPVSVEKFRQKRKENLILYVGRFSKLKQSKGQEILIDAFKKFIKTTSLKYKLILAGGSGIGTADYTDYLKKKSKGYPIEIIQNPTFLELVNLYAKAKFFWSAAGYGINEKKSPELVEHFGISLVEAMAAGAVPLVYAAGGFKEIVVGDCGILWTKTGELVANTEKISANYSLLKEMSASSQKRSESFSYEVFDESMRELFTSKSL